MRSAIRISIVVGVILIFGVSRPVLAQAAAPPETQQILDYHSDIRVRQDASLLMQETIRVRSAGIKIHHGIYRDFPTRYKDHLGNRYVVRFEVVGASRDGQPEQFRIEDQINGERICLGDEKVILPPGEYTYELEYTATRKIRFFADHDELYWNVTGSGWLFPIAHAFAAVTLPSGIPAASIHYQAYTGPQGSRGQHFTSSLGGDDIVSFVTLPGKSWGEREQ
ncbi:MAG: DUF2207 domain-containing protein [Terriglobales bacterium]